MSQQQPDGKQQPQQVLQGAQPGLPQQLEQTQGKQPQQQPLCAQQGQQQQHHVRGTQLPCQRGDSQSLQEVGQGKGGTKPRPEQPQTQARLRKEAAGERGLHPLPLQPTAQLPPLLGQQQQPPQPQKQEEKLEAGSAVQVKGQDVEGSSNCSGSQPCKKAKFRHGPEGGGKAGPGTATGLQSGAAGRVGAEPDQAPSQGGVAVKVKEQAPASQQAGPSKPPSPPPQAVSLPPPLEQPQPPQMQQEPSLRPPAPQPHQVLLALSVPLVLQVPLALPVPQQQLQHALREVEWEEEVPAQGQGGPRSGPQPAPLMCVDLTGPAPTTARPAGPPPVVAQVVDLSESQTPPARTDHHVHSHDSGKGLQGAGPAGAGSSVCGPGPSHGSGPGPGQGPGVEQQLAVAGAQQAAAGEGAVVRLGARARDSPDPGHGASKRQRQEGPAGPEAAVQVQPQPHQVHLPGSEAAIATAAALAAAQAGSGVVSAQPESAGMQQKQQVKVKVKREQQHERAPSLQPAGAQGGQAQPAGRPVSREPSLVIELE